MSDPTTDEAAEPVECPECFGDVHPDASRCRHCGALLYTPWWRTSWFTLLAGVAVGLVIVAVVFTVALGNADDDAEDCVDRIRLGLECDE